MSAGATMAGKQSNTPETLVLREARAGADIGAVRALVLAYQRETGFSPCFMGFDREVAELPGAYAPPGGRLIVAAVEGEPIGCVGIRPLADGICEMKRLYLAPGHRGGGHGRALAMAALDAARQLGYRAMRLDTMRTMTAARALYHALGFIEIAPYNDNPDDVVHYERPLDMVERRTGAS